MFKKFISFIIMFVYIQIIGRFIGMVSDLIRDFISNKRRQEPPKD